MIKCEICGKEFKSIRFGQHLRQTHQIEAKNYYDKYIKEDSEGICLNESCSNLTRFISIGRGYQRYCGNVCASTGKSCSQETRKKMREKHRTPYEKIRKSIENDRFELLTSKEEYENKHPKKLKVRCPEGHEFPMRWDGPKTGCRCQECANKIRGEKSRIPFEEVVKEIENRGFKLLSSENEYKNLSSKLKFECPNKHEFEILWSSFHYGSGCTICFNERKIQRMKNGGAAHARSFIQNPSKSQVELFNLVKEDHPESILEYPCLNYSIDIVIPNLKIAIEYDGSYWHQDQEKDDKRQREIEDQGWTFLRYRDYVPSKEELRKDIFNL